MCAFIIHSARWPQTPPFITYFGPFGTIAVGGTKIFFADFCFTDIKIGTQGFSGMVIPNLATVLLYEACARHFYQDVVNIYQDQKLVLLNYRVSDFQSIENPKGDP